MAANSNIEWTDATWTCITGCTRVSDGCDHCYSARMTHRLEMMGQQKYTGLTVLNQKGDRHFNGVVKCHDDCLTIPFKWKKPKRIFVNSMSDTFHQEVPFEFIDKVFAVMALCPQHTFQVLTKRPGRMAEYLRGSTNHRSQDAAAEAGWITKGDGFRYAAWTWPIPSVHIGTSIENQEQADRRIPELLRCPAAVRFLSCEPLLGPVDLTKYIGYNPMYENNEQRSGSLRCGENGAVSDKQGRIGLEDGGDAGEPVEWKEVAQANISETGRASSGTISPGAVDDLCKTNSLFGSSAGMASFQGANTGWAPSKSSKCGQNGQSSREPGTSDSERKQDAFASRGDDISVRTEKSERETQGFANSGDPNHLSIQYQDAEANRKAVSGVSSGGIEDCSGREQDKAGRGDSRLHKPKEAQQGCSRSKDATISWCIVGCESGPNRRSMQIDWARSIRDQCRSAGVPFFMKQMEVNGKISGDIDEFPADLRVREFPKQEVK